MNLRGVLMIMKMVNNTRKTEIARTVEVARSSWKKGLGLMFRSCIKENHGLLMEFSKESRDMYSIWMLGMRFPIDVVFINSERVVTDVYENVSPVSLDLKTWKVYKPTKPIKWILELKSGRCKRTKTVPGDKLLF